MPVQECDTGVGVPQGIFYQIKKNNNNIILLLLHGKSTQGIN